MIYSMAFCLSLDYSGSAENIILGKDNAVSHAALSVGGDGAVTAQVLAQLEVPVTATGFAAGYSGGEIELILRRQRVNTDFVYTQDGLSPVNFVLHHDQRTRFISADPRISFSDLTALMDKLSKLSDGDVLILSGDVPESLPNDIYEHIPDLFAGRDVRLVLDVPAEFAVKCLRFAPFLMATSPEQIAKAFGEPPQSEDEIFACITQFQEMGAQNVLVSLEGEGVLLLDSNGVKHRCVQERLSGDFATAKNAAIAGFIAGTEDNDVDSDYAVMLAAAASRAACAINGIPSKPKIIDIMKGLLKNYAAQ